MRADGREGQMGKRFAIVIGAAAAGVMALGAQTALAGGEPVDSVPPDLQVWTSKKQSLSRPDSRGTVEVGATCGEQGVGPTWPIDEEPPPPFFDLPDLGCTVRAEGELTKVKKDKLKAVREILPGPHVACYGTTCVRESGGAAQMELELRKKTRKQVRKALRKGKKVKAHVTVKAKDAAGNVATAKRTITLVK
jgi:hypothetical protein